MARFKGSIRGSGQKVVRHAGGDMRAEVKGWPTGVVVEAESMKTGDRFTVRVDGGQSGRGGPRIIVVIDSFDDGGLVVKYPDLESIELKSTSLGAPLSDHLNTGCAGVTTQDVP